MSRYDLTNFEWRVIEPLLPNKPRGVPRVDDRRVLNGIFWVLRSGAPWRDLPERYGPRTTCYNRFVRWRKAGVRGRLMDAISAAHNRQVQMIDSTSVRAHQQAAVAKKGVQITVSVDHAAGSRPRSNGDALCREDEPCAPRGQLEPSCAPHKTIETLIWVNRSGSVASGRQSWL